MKSFMLSARIAAVAASCTIAVAVNAFYERQAMAQAAQPGSGNLAAGQTGERITAATTVTSTAHYQAFATLPCTSVFCSALFPKVGAMRQLNITGVSCFITGDPATTFESGSLFLLNSVGAGIIQELIPVDFSSVGRHYSLNRTVDLQIAAGQQLKVDLQLDGGNAGQAFCTATGKMSTLQ